MFDNLKFLSGDVSIIKILMILYLIIFTNVISNKFSEKITNKINETIVLKHVIGLITIGIILSLLHSFDGKELLLYSIMIYFVFLLSTKISTDYIITFVVILSGLYFFDYFNNKKIHQISIDENISTDIKNKIFNNKKNNKKYITMLTIFTAICGSLMYENRKVHQYGGNFSLNKFLN